MAEKKGVGHAYNVDFLNVVFAASSLFLFLSVIWMVWDDFDRDWKNTQRRFAQLEYEVTQAQRQQAVGAVDKNKIAQLEAQKTSAAQQITANQAKVDELEDQLAEADKTLYRATLDYNYLKATYDQDRYDFETRRVAAPEAASTAQKAEGSRGPGEAAGRAEPGDGEGDRRQGRNPEAAECLHRAGRRRAEADRGAPDRADASRQAPGRPRAERHQEILPGRAAARLHGADDQGPADHPAERRRRRELHPRGEDGPVRDVPPRHRQEGLREVPAAVHDAPESGDVSRRQHAASDRQGRVHGLPRRHGAVGELPGRRAHAGERAAEEGVGGEVPLGGAAPLGLPDAAERDDRGVVREVPQAAGLRSQGRAAERGLRDLRARRLLRVPQDEGLRHRHPEAGADPDQDRLQAVAGLGEELDPQPARGEADDLDAALLVQLEQQRGRKICRATRRRSTASRRTCSRTPRNTSSR